jgi:hypothetical protein
MLQYHLLNIVKVEQPRWHDRVILPKKKKFVPGYNIMTINHKNWAGKYLIHTKQLDKYPIEVIVSKVYGPYDVYVIPLTDLKTIQENEADNAEIMETIPELFT